MKTELTQEEKRIKIAEACGWKCAYISGNGAIVAWRGDAPRCKEIYGRGAEEIPDYFNDLNDMHEAEKVLRPKQTPIPEGWEKWDFYSSMLEDLTGDDDGTHATAFQRAEAFGIALGLW